MNTTTKVADLNDRVQQTGKLGDPTENAKPMNESARRKEAEQLRIYTVKELLADSLERATSREPVVKCDTGVANLDHKTGGIRPGYFWVLAADTSFGKSSFAIMLADINLSQGKRVCIVTSEDDPSIYGDRLMVRRARVNALRYRDKRLSSGELEKVVAVAAQALPDPVLIDGRGKPAELIAKHVEEAIEQHNIDLIIYDYLQEMHLTKPSGDARLDFKSINSLLKQTVTTRGRAGVMLSQVTMTQVKKTPDKHSIRDCRDVANQAEVILIGYEPTENVVRKNGEVIARPGDKCIRVDKAKMGTKGNVVMSWDNDSACFNEIEPEPGPYDEFDDIADDWRNE